MYLWPYDQFVRSLAVMCRTTALGAKDATEPDTGPGNAMPLHLLLFLGAFFGPGCCLNNRAIEFLQKNFVLSQKPGTVLAPGASLVQER